MPEPPVVDDARCPRCSYDLRGAVAAGPAAWVALPLMEVAWWTAATSRYLRMPHAWGVGLAVTVVGVLLSVAVMAWIWIATNVAY